MSERIESALTPKEWADVDPKNIHGWDDGCLYVGRPRSREGDLDITDRLPALIALANAALPDSDPRKITREKIAFLRIEHISECDGDVCEYPTRELAAFADALESYLPPEK